MRSSVWPPISGAPAIDRKRSLRALTLCKTKRPEILKVKSQIEDELKQARTQVTELLEHANKRSSQIVEEAQEKARLEAEKIMTLSSGSNRSRCRSGEGVFRADVAKLAVAGAEKGSWRASVDQAAHKKLLAQLAKEF